MASADQDDEPVPRLPRPRGFRMSGPQVVRVAMTATLLVMVIMVQRPCADAVSGFVTGMDQTGSAATPTMPKPGTVDIPAATGSAADYEQLRPDMTEAELKAAIERAKARATGSATAPTDGSGSATGSGSGAGSAPAPAP